MARLPGTPDPAGFYSRRCYDASGEGFQASESERADPRENDETRLPSR